MATPIAIAVVEHEGRFLIGRRPAGVALAGLWEFPGGKIEAGETPEAAAVRECREEAGIAVEIVFRYPPAAAEYEHGTVELFFIGCRPVSDEVSPRGGYVWVTREKLSEYQFPSGNRQLLELLAADSLNASDMRNRGLPT